MHIKWEYFRISDDEIAVLKSKAILGFKDKFFDDSIFKFEDINFLGYDGWELTGIIEERRSFPELIFKRVQDEKNVSLEIYQELLNEVRKDIRENRYSDKKYYSKQTKEK